MQQAEVIRQLQAEVAKLKKPPTSSRNSSQPPSRDWKAKRASGKRRKKCGAKEGHAKAERPLVDNPDQVIPAKVMMCTQCGIDLSQVEPAQTIRRQLSELPEIKLVVIETCLILTDSVVIADSLPSKPKSGGCAANCHGKRNR